MEKYLKTNSLTALYDSVFIPVITAAEIDYRLELLDDEQRSLLEQNLADMTADLGASPRALPKTDQDQASLARASRSTCQVYCLPARAVREELAGAMLMQLLRQEGFDVHGNSTRLEADESMPPRNNLLEMAREGLGSHLAAAMRQARQEQREVGRSGIRIRTNGDYATVNLTVLPVKEPESLRGLLLLTLRPAPPPAEAGQPTEQPERPMSDRLELERELPFAVDP